MEIGRVRTVQNGIVVLRLLVGAEGVIAGSVVAGSAGILAGDELFIGALVAAIDVEPDDGLARIDEGLRELERVEGMGLEGIMELPENRLDLVIRCVGLG